MNFVQNKVICSKEILEKYFLDDNPFGDSNILKEPYITFNKILKNKLDNDYERQFGAQIYYGFGYEYNIIKDDIYEIKFITMRYYPIMAITELLKLCKNKVVWYAFEESSDYISKFYWNEKIKEEILCINSRKDVEEFLDLTEESDSEFWIWDYKPEKKDEWKISDSNNLIEKYFNRFPTGETLK